MATQTLPLPPALPRSASLFTPERLANPLLDHSTYSPFPTIPGSSHARDPYGLNAFLMHPSDSLWDYMQPAPAPPSEEDSPISVDHDETSVKGATTTSVQRKQSLRKQMSMGSLVPSGSPLAKELILEDGNQEVTVVRKRSKSVGSPDILLKELPVTLPAKDDLLDSVVDIGKTKTQAQVPQKTFRKALHKARSRFLGPAVPAESPKSTSSDTSSPSLADDEELPVVTYNRSSTGSESSSSSSSEGILTPSDPTPESPAAVATKLAHALESGTKKSWLGWLSGKRGPKSKEALSSPASSRGPSPPGSVISLTSTPSANSTPSPAKTNSSTSADMIEPPSRVSPSPDRSKPRTYTWVGAALRSASLRKATNLRRPAPHPLAVQLARAHGHLPEEIAFALRGESGQRVYPNSVNSPSYSLAPGGGLRITLGIKYILTQLDRGQLPPGTFSLPSPKPNANHIKNGGRKGMGDFVDRPPFEDRMLVFYANGSFSPISMARPGFGIWDLDYSAHILALASLESGDGGSSRVSKASSHHEEDDVKVSPSPGLPDTDVEIFVTPPPVTGAVFAPTEIAPPTSSSASSVSSSIVDVPTTSVKEENGALVDPTIENNESSAVESSFKSRPKLPDRPLSSFHNASSRSKTTEWDDPDTDESEEETVDDDKPLAMVMKRNQSMPNVTAQIRNRPVSMMPSPPSADFARATLPSTSRSSKRLSAIDPKVAKKEVVKARERREALLSGEIERRLEAQLEMEKRRSSMPPKRASLSTANLPSQASREKRMSSYAPQPFSSLSSPNGGKEDIRRRTQSTFEPERPTHVRTSTAPNHDLAVGDQSRRSMYELPLSSQSHPRLHSQSFSHSHAHAQAHAQQGGYRRQSTHFMPSSSFHLPPPQPVVYHHPAQAVFHPIPPQMTPMIYAMPHSGSMVFHPTPPPPVYGLPQSFSRSSITLPQKPPAPRR